LIFLATVALLQTTPCAPLDAIVPPEPGDAFIYETSVSGQALDILMRIEVVSASGLNSAFRQGGGLTEDLIEMSPGSPIRGYAGPAFPRSAGSGPRRREWSYSPSPDAVLAALDIGESRLIHAQRRNGGAGERFILSVTFSECDALSLDDRVMPANVYTIARVDDAGDTTPERVIWLSSETGWWLREDDVTASTSTRITTIED
jgi:hypothetical protein